MRHQNVLKYASEVFNTLAPLEWANFTILLSIHPAKHIVVILVQSIRSQSSWLVFSRKVKTWKAWLVLMNSRKVKNIMIFIFFVLYLCCVCYFCCTADYDIDSHLGISYGILRMLTENIFSKSKIALLFIQDIDKYYSNI